MKFSTMKCIMDFPIKIRILWTVIVSLVSVSFFNSVILVRIYALFDENNRNGPTIVYHNDLDVNISHKLMVEQFYRDRKFMSVSKLGAILFKNEKYPEIKEWKRNKTFEVLIWKRWKQLQKRHLYYFGETKHDPLKECSVNNCVFTGKRNALMTADAVVVNLQRGLTPITTFRKPKQRWIFLNDESPQNAFGLADHRVRFTSLRYLFNWSMTYMSDSDIPVPYGRTLPLVSPKYSQPDPPIANLIPYWKHKRWDVFVAILISNCKVEYRNKIISKLKDFIEVDVFGKCGVGYFQSRCNGYFTQDCETISDYLFYLVLENGKCMEYMTEKLYHNAYSKGAIPIIQGPSLEDCQKFLPPNSYLHVENYASMKALADDIKRISRNERELLLFHNWRNHFEIVEEHGYFGTKSVHLCRICEALNYNDDDSFVYSEKVLGQFLDPNLLCRDYEVIKH